MKVLITGGSGLLGQYLNIELSKNFDILTLHNSNAGNCLDFNNAKIDITDLNKLRDLVLEYKPDIIIHTAALTKPELVNNLDREFVENLNIKTTELLSQLSNKINCKLIFTSTDLVYDGEQGEMLSEDAKLNPISFYAETKLRSEELIQKNSNNFIILRTALLYGLGLNNSTSHFQQMYEKLKQGQEVTLFTDQYRTPLSLANAATIISDLCKLDTHNQIINFGGKERVSRYDLGEKLCEIKGLNKQLLIPSLLSKAEFLTAKVADVSMNTDKLRNLGIKISSISESINNID